MKELHWPEVQKILEGPKMKRVVECDGTEGPLGQALFLPDSLVLKLEWARKIDRSKRSPAWNSPPPPNPREVRVLISYSDHTPFSDDYGGIGFFFKEERSETTALILLR